MSLEMFKKEQIILWLVKNFKAILAFCAILILIVVSFLTWNWQKKQQEYKAQVSLSKLKNSLKALTKEDESNFNFFKKREEKELVLTKEMEQRAYSYDQAVRKNKKFQSAVVGAIDLADFYYRYGKKDQAKELLSLFASPLKKRSLYHLAVFQLAGYYMNEKNCKEALPLFSQLISNKTAKAFHLESRLQKAICLEADGNYQLALEEYEQINIENSKDYIGRLANDYKKMLILKEKLKK